MSKQGASILVVDDEKEIVRALQHGLAAHGYTVLTASTGREALEAVRQRRPDLLLLDLMLPDISGLEICHRIRAESNVPILILSVKDAEHEKVEALDLGADDYVPKPFGMDEVLARVRVALRHAAQLSKGREPQFLAGPLCVDFSRRRVTIEGREVALTPTEFDLLKVFITHRGKLLTRQMLLKEVWGEVAHARIHSLHVYVAQLRQKIEATNHHYIRTVPGVGYSFIDEEEL